MRADSRVMLGVVPDPAQAIVAHSRVPSASGSDTHDRLFQIESALLQWRQNFLAKRGQYPRLKDIDNATKTQLKEYRALRSVLLQTRLLSR